MPCTQSMQAPSAFAASVLKVQLTQAMVLVTKQQSTDARVSVCVCVCVCVPQVGGSWITAKAGKYVYSPKPLTWCQIEAHVHHDDFESHAPEGMARQAS